MGEFMAAKTDTGTNVAWGRVLVGIGVIVALVALGALEVFTARFPADVARVGQAGVDDGSVRPDHDVFDARARFARHDPRGAPVDEGSETEPSGGR
jgi:hypothetical protein